MKKIITAIALVAAASPALADDKCENIDKLSEAIMQARQQGVPLRKSLSLASGISIGKTITLDAYKQPRWSGEKHENAPLWIFKTSGIFCVLRAWRGRLMSVDYTENVGIGFKVCEAEDLDEECLEDGLEEYIENNISDGFWCGKSGSRMSGDIDGTYLFIDGPFSKGLDLTWAKEALEREMDRLCIVPEGEFGLVGGILQW